MVLLFQEAQCAEEDHICSGINYRGSKIGKTGVRIVLPFHIPAGRVVSIQVTVKASNVNGTIVVHR